MRKPSSDYPAGTVALAVVRGVPDVLVLRRRCYPVLAPQAGFPEGGWHYDWAHSNVHDIGFTCSNDDEVEVTAVVNVDTAYVVPNNYENEENDQ
jgi:hypothetical protein